MDYSALLQNALKYCIGVNVEWMFQHCQTVYIQQGKSAGGLSQLAMSGPKAVVPMLRGVPGGLLSCVGHLILTSKKLDRFISKYRDPLAKVLDVVVTVRAILPDLLLWKVELTIIIALEFPSACDLLSFCSSDSEELVTVQHLEVYMDIMYMFTIQRPGRADWAGCKLYTFHESMSFLLLSTTGHAIYVNVHLI